METKIEIKIEFNLTFEQIQQHLIERGELLTNKSLIEVIDLQLLTKEERSYLMTEFELMKNRNKYYLKCRKKCDVSILKLIEKCKVVENEQVVENETVENEQVVETVETSEIKEKEKFIEKNETMQSNTKLQDQYALGQELTGNMWL